MRTTIVVLSLAAAAFTGPAASQGRGFSTDPSAAPSGVYRLDKRHAALTAGVRHLGFSRFVMRFESFDASIRYDSDRPTQSQVDATVDVDSVRTPLAEFNAVIAKSYLGGDDQPQASFASRRLEQTSATEGVMSGDLTLNGVSRPVELKVTFNGTGPGLSGTPVMGFSATGTISRRDFNVASGVPDFIASDTVEIEIEAEFRRQ